MWVRGAPLIGATAAWGVAIAMREDASDAALDAAWRTLHVTRPTAINLRWALDRMDRALRPLPVEARGRAAHELAVVAIADEDVEINRRLGEHGLELIRAIADAKPAGETVNVLTHCNAGWLATVDWGHGPRPRSTTPTRRASRCASGSTRPGPGTRAR